jgi:carboxylesterase
VRRLGKFLNKNGFTVSGPMLRGHGTIPESLEEVIWTDWQEDIAKKYLQLSGSHQQVYLVGTSLGANIPVLLAEKYSEIAGIVLLAMPYRFKIERALFYLARLSSFFKKYYKKFYPPTLGARQTITRLISYQSYPIQSIFEVFAMIKKSREALGQVFQPVLVMQSLHDHIVAKDNLEIIYQSLGTNQKEKKYIPRAYHTFIADIKNEHIFEDILNFIAKNFMKIEIFINNYLPSTYDVMDSIEIFE